jgi:hypothetical protein
MAIESLVRKKHFLTSEQSECCANLSIDGAKYVVAVRLESSPSAQTPNFRTRD